MSQLVSIDRWNRSFVFSHDSVKDPGSTFTKIDRDILDAKLEPLRQRWDLGRDVSSCTALSPRCVLRKARNHITLHYLFMCN